VALRGKLLQVRLFGQDSGEYFVGGLVRRFAMLLIEAAFPPLEFRPGLVRCLPPNVGSGYTPSRARDLSY